jgi:mannose-1-phosphate guanylyltransferase
MPKQFVKLFDNKSLFELTLKRNSKVCSDIFIVSNEAQYFLALDQIEENSKLNIQNSKFLLEPVGRNTAPAIALACMALDKDEVVLVTPSDHLIKNEKEYQKVVNQAKLLAKEDNLVTFGIKPTFAETGFGYIQAKPEGSNGECLIMNVELFHEKPNLETAKKYIEENSKFKIQNSKLFLWNSGMFCFKAGVFLDELQKYSPEIYKTSKEAFKKKKIQNSTLRIKHSDMLSIPEDSIDYAVMEKSNKVKVVLSDIDWSDVGSFDSLIKENIQTENKDRDSTIEIDSRDNFYYSDNSKKLIATVGLEDFIVVDTKDALLITKKGESQKVKEIVNKLKIQNSKLIIEHSIVHRPWGTYETLIEDTGYKIKRIIVKPNKRLSLQKHFHRNEHWIVVSGTATVTVGDEVKLVRPNESTYIKMGEIHRLENKGKIPIVLIEAQVGEYTGEDDIVRIEDDFNRES